MFAKDKDMKLYDVPPKTRIKVGDTELFFDHLDGMYSCCLTDEEEIVHLARWTEVEIIK